MADLLGSPPPPRRVLTKNSRSKYGLLATGGGSLRGLQCAGTCAPTDRYRYQPVVPGIDSSEPFRNGLTKDGKEREERAGEEIGANLFRELRKSIDHLIVPQVRPGHTGIVLFFTRLMVDTLQTLMTSLRAFCII